MGGTLSLESKVGVGSTFRFAIVLPETEPEDEGETLDELMVRAGLKEPDPAVLEAARRAEEEAERTFLAELEELANRAGARAQALAEAVEGAPAAPPDETPAAETVADPPAADASDAEPAPRRKSSADAPLAGVRVLVAEDNKVNQMVAKRILESSGCEVGLADDGQVACEMVDAAAAAGTPWDVVLMDCQMPVMDGFDATRRIRENVAYRELPIIAVTANAMIGDREQCLESGMDDFVPKPVKRPLLVQTIERQLARRAEWDLTGA